MNRNFTFSLLLGAFTVTTIFTSCEDDERAPLVIPTEYDGSGYEANAKNELTLATELNALTAAAKVGRTGSEVSAEDLSNLFTTGSPSLKSASTIFYAGKLEGDAGFLNQLSLASGNTYIPGETSEHGGKYGDNLFDENGVEMEQLIEKGLFGAALYNRAASLLSGELSAATTDQVIALFGATPSFKSSNVSSKHGADADRFIAGYAARRDKNDGQGFYSNVKNGLIKLQAAVKAGSDYQTEQAEAITAIKENWEKANAATMINYSHSVISTLSATDLTDDSKKAGALHSIAECIGFIMGWSSIPQEHKIITDNQIEEILILLNAPLNGTATTYTFVTDRENQVAKIQELIEKLQAIYGFTDTEVEEFKSNWVALQDR